jgi:hypothetical protein
MFEYFKTLYAIFLVFIKFKFFSNIAFSLLKKIFWKKNQVWCNRFFYRGYKKKNNIVKENVLRILQAIYCKILKFQPNNSISFRLLSLMRQACPKQIYVRHGGNCHNFPITWILHRNFFEIYWNLHSFCSLSNFTLCSYLLKIIKDIFYCSCA